MRKTRLPVSLNERDLDDHRQRFDDEDAADEYEQELLLDQQRDGAERAAQAERADVAHEDVGGVGVPPQKAEAGADQGAAEHRQLTGQR